MIACASAREERAAVSGDRAAYLSPAAATRSMDGRRSDACLRFRNSVKKMNIFLLKPVKSEMSLEGEIFTRPQMCCPLVGIASSPAGDSCSELQGGLVEHVVRVRG